MIDMLAARIINRRLETRARAGGSYIQAQVDLDDVSRSVNGTFVNIMPIGDDWEAAVRDVRAVIADAMANPPDQAEIDRAVAEFDAIMKQGVQTAAAEPGTDPIGRAHDGTPVHNAPLVSRHPVAQKTRTKD